MIDFSQIQYLNNPNEITRNNWIIGFYRDIQTGIHYEVHFCKGDSYKHGVLIDDTWSQNQWPIEDGVKVDIYIVNRGFQNDDYVLPDLYCNFVSCKKIKKMFLLYENLDGKIQEILSTYISLESCYEDISFYPKLSIITTVYNNALLLEQTIQSVINQKSSDYEYIIKDAYSTDGFDRIVEKYLNYGIKVIREKDEGIYHGMHQGFKAASGEYIQILNSDDVFYDSKVVATYIEKIMDSKTNAYCSDIDMYFPGGKKVRRKPDLKKLRYQSCINHTSLALKKSDYVNLGGFDKHLFIAADCDLTIKMVRAGLRIEYIPYVSVKFRMGGASSELSLKLLKEELICRFHYSKWNIDGYIFTLMNFLKKCFKIIINKG